MNLRDEMVSRFNGTIGKVLWMTEKFFFEQYPDEKARYKSFKKDVETYKYASDEEIFTHKDKTGKIVKLERRDALLIALLKEHSWLAEKVKDAARTKDRIIEREAAIKAVEAQKKRDGRAILSANRRALRELKEGKITQEVFDIMKANNFGVPLVTQNESY